MTEGTEDSAAGQVVFPGVVSPIGIVADVGPADQEKRDETGVVGGGVRAGATEEEKEEEKGEEKEGEKEEEEEEEKGMAGEEGGEGESTKRDEEGDGGGDGRRAPVIVGLAGTCCVCIEMERVGSCLRSEKICIVPILACLLSLALCTAGLKWVFVDKIFEYDAPTHSEPKRFGQDPVIISADPARGLPVSFTHVSSSSSSSSLSPIPVLSTTTATPAEDRDKGKSAGGPSVPQSTAAAQVTPTAALTYQADRPKDSGTLTSPKQTSYSRTTMEFNGIYNPTVSTTPSTKTSSHVTRCTDKERKYCVNGGECFTLEVMPGSTKFLCRCLSGYTGNRCQEIVPKRVMNHKQHLGIEFMEAEELYQKRVLTITGICIALLVVGIMCVVAYCKTKKQRKNMHDRLRQSRKNERINRASVANGPRVSNTPENVQLMNQDISKNATAEQHVTGNETETSFSCSAHHSTVTQASSQRSESVLSRSHSVVMSSGESSQHALPSQRGRLNAIGGATDLSAHPNKPNGLPPHNPAGGDSAHSERYTPAARPGPARRLASPVTPDSPLSESAPLSSLAESVPSMALSPSGEDERPLLFTPCVARQPSGRGRGRNPHARNSAHYNHGNEVQSAPSSPLIAQHGSHRDHEVKPASNMAAVSVTMTQANTNGNNNRSAVNTAEADSHALGGATANSDGPLEGRGSESEAEDDATGEDRPFLDTPPSDSSVDRSRTNAAPQHSPQDTPQTSVPPSQCQPRSTCSLQ